MTCILWETVLYMLILAPCSLFLQKKLMILSGRVTVNRPRLWMHLSEVIKGSAPI